MPLDATGVPDDLVPLGGPSAAAPTAMPQPQALPSDLMPIPKDIVPVGASAPKPPEDTGLLAAPFAGMLRGSAEVGQLPSAVAREKVEPLPEENTVAAQQVELTDLLNPKQLAEKSLYQFGRNFPALTGGVAGGVLGTMIEPGLGTAIGGGLGAGMATAAQSLGPEFARALKENPKDPDAAFNTALTRAAVSGDISGASWGLFGWAPFSGTVKNMLFQAFGVQPAVTATGTAVENVIEGKPAGQGVAESIPGAVTGTLVPMAGHAAIPYAAAAARRVFGAGAPPPAAAGAGAAGTPPPGAGPAASGAVPPDTMPPPGTTVNVAGEADPLTVKGYRGDLVDLEAADGKPRMMTQADFAKLHTVAQPSPRPGRLPALPPSETLYGPGQPWASTGEGMIPGTPGFTMRRPGTEPAAPAPTPHTPVTLDDIDRWATEEHAAQASGENPTPAEHVTSPIEAAVEEATKPAAEILQFPGQARLRPPEQRPEPEHIGPQPQAVAGVPQIEPNPGGGFDVHTNSPAGVLYATTREEAERLAQRYGLYGGVPANESMAPETPPAMPQAAPFVEHPINEGTGQTPGPGVPAQRMPGFERPKSPPAPVEVVPTAPQEPGITVTAPEPAPEPEPVPAPSAAVPENGPTVTQEKHTKTGADIFAVRFPQKPDIDGLGAQARKMGGYWSSFRGGGMQPGWMFKTPESAQGFADWARGEMGPAVPEAPSKPPEAPSSPPAPADKALEYQVAEPHPAKPEQAAEYPPPTLVLAAPSPVVTPQVTEPPKGTRYVLPSFVTAGLPHDVVEEAAKGREMDTPTPGLPAQLRIADWVRRQIEGDIGFDAKTLQSAMEHAQGGKLAEGKFTRADMYDAMELGVNRYVEAHPEMFSPIEDLAVAQRAVARLEDLKNRLPTQTVRAGEKDTFQQFSTPPDYAYTAAWAAGMRPGQDVVIEPSAGTGSLVAAAHNAGPRELITNELSANRAPLVESLNPDRSFRENAEQLHNVLPADVRPTVVIMNPPFSATAGRMGDKTVLMTGARHIEQALERLEPGGRLVAIVGQGMRPFTGEATGRRGEPTGSAFRDWWRRISQNYDVRANIGVPGSVYGKYGTTFGTRLLVIDKGPPGGWPPVESEAKSLPDAMEMLDEVRRTRNTSQQMAAELGSEAVAGPSPRPNEPGPAVSGAVPVGGIRGGSPISGAGAEVPGGPGPSSGAIVGPEPRPGGGNEVANQQPERSGPVGAEPITPAGVGAGEVVAGGRAEPHGVVLRPEGGAGSILPAGGESQDIAEGPAPVPIQVDEAVAEPHAGGEITESVYEPYQPQRIKIAGAKPHPGDLVQSAAMASVMPPIVDYVPKLPKELISTGALSQAQLEPIVYAGHAHSQMLPAGEGETTYRRGYFIGDGTGVGKGREIAGIILDNFQRGRNKAVWISENKTLLKDAQRDWSGVGQNPKDIFEVGKTKAGEDLKPGRGIAFLPYDTLKSAERTGKDAEGKTIKGRRRLDQLATWLGKDFDGVIAFDEAHNMANSLQVRGDRGVKDASQKALAGIELQKMLPNARVVYVSATGATEVSNLAYADRLGLWGRGTPFPNKQEFINQIGRGGIAAMELVARDMKAMGHYLARNLSYDDVKYDRLEHNLSPEQKDIYDSLAEGWQHVLANINAALLLTGPPDAYGRPQADSQQKKNALSAFWGAHQRFFNQIITSMQMPSVLRSIEGDIKEGRQAVLQLVNTNEAPQTRAIAKRAAQEGAGEDLYEDLDLTPRDQLMQMIDKSFPTAQIEEYLDENGNERTREVRDAAGNIIHNKQALALKERLLDRVGSIRVPDGPLEMALNHFGVDNVAEITGRGQRVVRKPDKSGTVRAQLETRPGSANENETNAFQNAKKKVLIFSQAGGTGRSYHAEIGTPSAGAQRSHYLIQAGWRADKAIQGFGRTHRTNQASAPIFHLVTTDLQGQRRFISSIARRLSQLGALTKGERRAGESGLFGPKDNLESREADTALSTFWRDLQRRAIEGVDSRDFEKQTGLALENKKGEWSKPPEITQFLNRLLSLKFDMQNQVFGEFERRLNDAIDSAAAAGTLDVGAETYKADRIRKDTEKTVYTDPKSGAETKYVRLAADHRNHPADFAQVNNGRHRVTGHDQPLFYAVSKRSGRIVAVTNGGNHTDTRTGDVTPQYRLADALHWDYVPQYRLDDERNWQKVEDRGQAKPLWDQQVAAIPEYRSEDVHLITGAVLPIWDRLSGYPKVYRLQTDAGERMLGRVIDEGQIRDVLKALGAETAGKQFTPEQVAARILDGDQATLANGWKLKRSLVVGEPRIELTGPYFAHDAELAANGLFKERIQYDTRYFVPTGEDAPKVLARLLAEHPISEFAATSRGLAEEHPPGFATAPAAPGEYRDLRADFATMPQGEPHAAARDWTLDRGRASGFEHLAAYDPAEAAVTHAYTMGMPRAVAISPELDRRLDDPNANVVLHHNHPSGNSLSRSDVQMLSRPGIAAIIAHSHDGGDTFAARPTDRTRELSLKNEGIARMLLGGMYESVGKTVKERLQGLIFKGRISPQQAERSYADLVNRAMGAAGYTHYLSTQSFDPVLAPAVAGIIHAAAAPIRRTDLSPGDFNALVNRSTDAVRPDEILAGLPGAAEANAARPGRAAGVAAGAAGTSPSCAAVLAAAGLAEDRPKDFSDRATEEAINQAMGPPGSKPPGNWFSRLQDNLGANPRTPAGTHKDFAWSQKGWTLPSTKGSTDPMSNPKWLTELAKHRDTAMFLNQYKDGLASWSGKPMEQWRRVFAALELYTLEGIDMPTDGRAIVIENRDRPLAALSKIGDIARLDNPDDIKMAIDYRNTMDQVWQNLVAETARQFGWTGTPSSRAISDAASAATSPAAEASLRRAAKIVAAIEYQHRNSYLPLMRHGDYFIRVTPKAGTLDKPGILGWTGDGYPPTTLFKLIDSRTPTERVMGGMRSGIPKTAQAEIAELQRQFPSTEYDIDHGYMFAKANQLRDLDIPAVEKLMMLVGNDARGQMADRLRHTGMSADEAKTAAQGDYDRMVDAVLDRVYEERVAGFKKPRSGVPGYDPDFGRATSDYLHWLAGYTSGLRHRPAMERADAMIAQHPDPHTRVFWRNFDRRQEDYGDELHGPLMHIRQGAFYWLLGMNAASTAKIMLHGPLLGMPTMTTGLGGMGHAQAAGDFIAAAGSILKDMRLNSTTGFTVDLTKAARTPEERALLADSEAKGITHPQGADELSAMRGRGETAMTPQQNFARRALEVWGSNISAADRLNRGALLLSSFRTANRVGMDTINRVWDRDLNWKNQPVKTPHTWAQFIVDRATGIWGDINRLPWARGQLGGMVAQFRTYVINYLSTMWQMMSRMGPEGKVSATLMLGSLGLLGGATALPLFEDALSAANWLYGLLSDIDPDLEGSMKKAVDALEPGMGETVMHGVRPFGIDYGSIGFGDELSKNMQSPLDLFGAGISMPLTAIGRAVERYRSGQDDLSIARELAPSAVKNLIGGMYPETALASATHGTMALAPSQLSAADQAKMGLGFRPEAMALHQEQVTQQIHRASAFKQALALGEDRIANMTARGVDTRGAIADLDRTIERGVAEGVLSKEQINEVKGALRARLMQRLHPEISSKATQRFQAAQPAP